MSRKFFKNSALHAKKFSYSGVKLKPPPSFHAKWLVPYAYMYDIFENCL